MASPLSLIFISMSIFCSSVRDIGDEVWEDDMKRVINDDKGGSSDDRVLITLLDDNILLLYDSPIIAVVLRLAAGRS
jgi:hypothetical protein